MHHPFRFIFFGCCFFTIAVLFGQGKITVEGYTTFTDAKGKKSALADINVHVYKGTEKEQETTTNKKGKYKLELEYGFQYKVVFENNPGYIDMSFMVDGKIPPAKKDLNPTIDLEVPMFETGTDKIDTLKFKFPFTKFKFDGNKKFIDDAKYLNDFERGLFKEYKEAQKKIKKQKADKAAQDKLDATGHFVLIGGKLMYGDGATNPVKHMKLHLISERGIEVETATTDKNGRFSFSKFAPDRMYSIKMDDNDSLKLFGSKITMVSRSGKEVYVTTANAKGGFTYKLLAADKLKTLDLEIEDNGFLVSGIIEAVVNEKNQPVAKARVVLADAVNGSIYEVVETDGNGRFVYSQLPPDRNYVVRLEESNPELAGVKVIMKDKTGFEIASSNADGFGKFRFQMLASDRETLDRLQIDESEIKMDIIGKFLAGDEKNSILSNIKVNLVDDQGIVIQTTTSDDKGIFVFKNLILYGGYFFELDATDMKINSLSAVMLAEKEGKIVKEYKVDITQGIKYRILGSDQKKLGRLYMK